MGVTGVWVGLLVLGYAVGGVDCVDGVLRVQAEGDKGGHGRAGDALLCLCLGRLGPEPCHKQGPDPCDVPWPGEVPDSTKELLIGFDWVTCHNKAQELDCVTPKLEFLLVEPNACAGAEGDEPAGVHVVLGQVGVVHAAFSPHIYLGSDVS